MGDAAILPAQTTLQAEVEIERVVRQHNRRLFRIARAILRNDADAEDVVQDTYVHGFRRLGTFRATGSLEAWLSRIAVNLAYARLRKTNRRTATGASMTSLDSILVSELADTDAISAERHAASSQLGRIIETEVDRLMDGFREVFVLRAMEELSVAETAEILDIPQATVKTRFHRARSTIRAALAQHADQATAQAFPFAGARCDRMVGRVMARMRELGALAK